MRTPSLVLLGACGLALGIASSARAARPDEPGSGELFRFEDNDVVETFDTARFRIHFTRAGINAVPSADADTSGVPDHVEQLGGIYEEVLTFYTDELGFRAPLGDVGSDPQGDERFDVYLVDFGLSADGTFRSEVCSGATCAGFMVQENDFAGYGYPSKAYANRLLASHELFHAVQAAYDAEQGAVLSEGTAVWASEHFDPSLDDLELFAGAFLEETDRPIDSDGVGPVDSFTYGSALFWEYLSEQLGPQFVRALWEACADAPNADWFTLLDGVLRNAGATGFADVYSDFAIATLLTGDRADPARGLAHGDTIPELAFDDETLPFFDDSFLVFISSYQTLAVNPTGRAQLRVAVVGEGSDVEGIRLALAPLSGNTVGEVLRAPTLDVTVDAVAAEFVIVQLVNTRQSGSGARPALCVGAPDEVDDCLLALAPRPQPDEGPDAQAAGCAGTSAATHVLPMFVLLALVLARAGRRPQPGANAASAP